MSVATAYNTAVTLHEHFEYSSKVSNSCSDVTARRGTVASIAAANLVAVAYDAATRLIRSLMGCQWRRVG